MKTIQYTELEGRSTGFFALMAILITIIGAGLVSALMMHGEGHHITGMTNRIVWGTPHVFAVFLIVAASGALNIASISSVFGRTIYKPLSPLSMVLSMTILAGGLAVLILDLGNPEHLLDIPLTQFLYNSEPARWTRSVFGWNFILYSGFMVIVGIYLWFTLVPQYKKFTKAVSVFAFVWRLALTTGTGLIFGFLVAREAYDAAILAPMFVTFSFAYGLAIFALVLIPTYAWTDRELGDVLVNRLKSLLGIFVAASLYFVIIFNLMNFYSAAKSDGIQSFLLFGDNSYSKAFWIGQIFIGGILPLAIVFYPKLKARGALIVASVMVIIGGLSQMYVTIIGGQAYPMDIFPGKIVESITNDGGIASYSPTIYEVLLGLAGIGIMLFLVVFAMNVLRILPESLADKDVDPHHSA